MGKYDDKRNIYQTIKSQDELAELQAENKRLEERNKDLISGHFCPQPQLSKLADSCNCAHSDRHREVDWASIDKLQAENKLLKKQFNVLSEMVILQEPEMWEAYLQALKDNNGTDAIE